VRAEWWRDGPLPWSIGVAHTHLDERGRRPNDPANDLVATRRDWLGIARLHWQVGEQLSFEPQVIAGNVQNRQVDGVNDIDDDRFEGKLAWNVRWDFGPDTVLAVYVSVELDQIGFGGGGAQFVARF
jgi:hypothetical protein